MNNVLALQMLSDDVGGTVETSSTGAPGAGESLGTADNDWDHGHGGGHGHGRSHISLLLCH